MDSKTDDVSVSSDDTAHAGLPVSAGPPLTASVASAAAAIGTGTASSSRHSMPTDDSHVETRGGVGAGGGDTGGDTGVVAGAKAGTRVGTGAGAGTGAADDAGAGCGGSRDRGTGDDSRGARATEPGTKRRHLFRDVRGGVPSFFFVLCCTMTCHHSCGFD